MTLLLKNRWNIEHDFTGREDQSLLDALLRARGFDMAKTKDLFLSPPLDAVQDPFLFHDMNKACETILEAIRLKEKIVIFGDYDVDGITSTSMLFLFLSRQGADVEFIIPDRILEGYGLTDAGVRKILGIKAKLVITVDCGIASIKEVEDLVEKKVKVVITDHHECKKTLPNAYAVLNPKRTDSRYPFRELAGAGVVLKLIQALCIRTGSDGSWKSYIELAAIGTIADVVPLCGENRTIVHHGLIEMNRSSNIGLKSLIRLCEKGDKSVTAVTVGYTIAPRINAAGRMGDSNRAVRLLTTTDYQEAIGLAGDLINDNRKRQEIELQIFDMAKEQIRTQNHTGGTDIIVVYEKGWHQGVIGIVASRLVDLYHRSVIIFGGEDGFYKGSARSAGDESILEAIEFAGTHVLQFGGHKKAAGLVVSDQEMESFLQSIREFSRLHPSNEVVDPAIQVDFEIPFEQITCTNAVEVSLLAPFGEGNPQPLFVCRNMTVQQIRFLSSGKHMKMILGPSSCLTDSSVQPVEAIAFGFSEKTRVFSSGDRVDAVFSIEQNEWNGGKTVEIIVKDIQKSYDVQESRWIRLEDSYRLHPEDIMSFIKEESIPVKDVIPQKHDFIAVYQYLKTNHPGEAVLCDLDLMAELISNNYQISLTVFKLARIFDIFMEVDVIHFTIIRQYRMKFRLLDVLSKVSLANSPTYKALCIESVIS